MGAPLSLSLFYLRTIIFMKNTRRRRRRRREWRRLDDCSWHGQGRARGRHPRETEKEKGALQSSSSSFSFRVPLSFSLEIWKIKIQWLRFFELWKKIEFFSARQSIKKEKSKWPRLPVTRTLDDIWMFHERRAAAWTYTVREMKWNRGVNGRGVETATILFIAVCLLFTFDAEK